MWDKWNRRDTTRLRLAIASDKPCRQGDQALFEEFDHAASFGDEGVDAGGFGVEEVSDRCLHGGSRPGNAELAKLLDSEMTEGCPVAENVKPTARIYGREGVAGQSEYRREPVDGSCEASFWKMVRWGRRGVISDLPTSPPSATRRSPSLSSRACTSESCANIVGRSERPDSVSSKPARR